MNVMTNAVEAIKDQPGGEILLRTRIEDRGAQEGEGQEGAYRSAQRVVVEVSDNGAGMTTDQVARAFEPFFTTKFMGRGLGLAAAQGIVRAHHGTISICSSPETGTSVTVSMPMAGQRGTTVSAVPAPAEPRLAAGEQRTILIVDDEAHVRAVASGILKRAGFAIELAEHGGAALSALSENPAAVDLILLDLTMPGLDGLEVLERVRQLRTGLPVLLSSGYGPEAIAHILDDDPHVRFLSKPYRRQALLDAVSELIQTSEQAPGDQ